MVSFLVFSPSTARESRNEEREQKGNEFDVERAK